MYITQPYFFPVHSIHLTQHLLKCKYDCVPSYINHSKTFFLMPLKQDWTPLTPLKMDLVFWMCLMLTSPYHVSRFIFNLYDSHIPTTFSSKTPYCLSWRYRALSMQPPITSPTFSCTFFWLVPLIFIFQTLSKKTDSTKTYPPDLWLFPCISIIILELILLLCESIFPVRL